MYNKEIMSKDVTLNNAHLSLINERTKSSIKHGLGC